MKKKERKHRMIELWQVVAIPLGIVYCGMLLKLFYSGKKLRTLYWKIDNYKEEIMDYEMYIERLEQIIKEQALEIKESDDNK